jgi:hypothetical protein
MDVASFPHQVTRLIFDTGQPYQEFRARYEDAVPELDPKHLAAFAERAAPWPEVIADADASAPHGFLIYWRSDLTPVMSLAGDPARCTAYLMGNHHRGADVPPRPVGDAVRTVAHRHLRGRGEPHPVRRR